MRLWQLRLHNIVISRVVESESPESHVLERSRSTLDLIKSESHVLERSRG